MPEDLPRIAHVPMALATQGSTLMTVTQRVAEAYARMGGVSVAVLSDNRDLVTPGVDAIYVDYTERCPRQWFTRRELAVDVAAGRLGLGRPYYGRMYDPAIRALQADRPDLVLLYEGHYASATLPRWRWVRDFSHLCLYVHNPLSRSYGPAELRRLLGAADRVIFCADHLKRDVIRRLGAKPLGNLETIHNGIDDRFRAPAPRTSTEGEFSIVFFGRVAPNKGVHLVLRAAAAAAERTARPLRVRVVGSSEYSAGGPLSPYEAEVRDLGASLALPVDFMPFLPPAELKDVLRSSSVACLPSTWAEGFPLAALEAMATGLPVICSDSPGMLEACGDAALVAPMGDVGGLADAIVTLAGSDAEWERRSASGWERARRFSWERTARAITLPGPGSV